MQQSIFLLGSIVEDIKLSHKNEAIQEANKRIVRIDQKLERLQNSVAEGFRHFCFWDYCEAMILY